MNDTTTCPFLKEVSMVWCEACAVRKMLPRDHLVSTGPCLAENHTQCPLYAEALRRLDLSSPPGSGPSRIFETTGKEVPQ